MVACSALLVPEERKGGMVPISIESIAGLRILSSVLSLRGFLEVFRRSAPSDQSRASVGSAPPAVTIEPAFKRLVMYFLVGTRGGHNRMKIIRLLKAEPMNANRIGEKLELDYKTVQHHIKVLEENKFIEASSPKGTYGTMYFLSPYFEKKLALMDEMWVGFGKS